MQSMEILNFLVRVSARIDFLPRQNISSFVADFFFLSKTKHPKVTRLAFDRAQVLEWVSHNNCNY